MKQDKIYVEKPIDPLNCEFKCLECPYPPGQDCVWDDPLIGMFDRIEYPEFFWWRFNHLPEKKKPYLLMPDSMDEFYKEPEGKGYRCPRCLSTKVHFGDVWIKCKKCGYNETLIDYPENLRCGLTS